MFGNTLVRMRGGLLFGGLLCLALAAPLAARADAPRQQDSPQALAAKLEAALRAGDDRAVAAVLADTPENRGRRELLAFLDEQQAAGVLEYILEEEFGPGEKVEAKTWWKDVRIEAVSDPAICGVMPVHLQVTLTKEDGSVETRDVPAYLELDGDGLVLPEGFVGLSAEDSDVVIDLSRYTAKLFAKTTDEVGDGKYETREQVIQALRDDLGQSEPMQRYMTQVAGPALAKAVAKAIDEAFKEALKKAAQEAVNKQKIVGSWQMPDCPDCPVWSFTKDGQATLVSVEDVLTGRDVPHYRYELDGSTLKLIPIDDQDSVQVYTIAQLTDTVLVLVDSHGDRIELQK